VRIPEIEEKTPTLVTAGCGPTLASVADQSWSSTATVAQKYETQKRLIERIVAGQESLISLKIQVRANVQ
jgi:hypothetical protein